MVVFALVSVPVSFVNLQHRLGVLNLLDSNVGVNASITKQVMLLLQTYNSGILLVQVFWGLWLLPFGYLVYRSGFLPKVLGVLLMLGCFGYLLSSFGDILAPAFAQSAFSKYITLPASLGEIVICLWLLIKGVKNNNYAPQ